MNAQQQIAKIKNVNVKPLGNMVYIKWITTNNNNECLYSILKSKNGKNFKTIGAKKGLKLESDSIDLLYTFVDFETKNTETNYYKIFLIDNLGEIKESKSIIVNSTKN
ncbi:MAG: hypothetical protein DRI94_13470 [Bacteroidetes bacterium]|nr:MAG: hypothetical protein DRI94_13470 [Bacteroidota bacterium]